MTADKASSVLDGLFPQRPVRRILLVVPPDAEATLFRFATAKRGRYTNYPPYGLGLIATALGTAGVDVRILNLNHAVLEACGLPEDESGFDFDTVWQSALTSSMVDYLPDLVGVTCMFTMTHGSLKAVCAFLKRHWTVPICAGGVHVTSSVDLVMREIPEIDAAFLREAELAFHGFVQYLNGQRPADELSQVVLRDGAGSIKVSRESMPTAASMDMIPAYPLLDLEKYSRYGTIGAFYCFKPKGTVFATILGNRGCRAQCTFCGVRSFNGAGVRQRSVGSVVDELQYLEEVRGVGHVMWLDDDLLMNHGHTIALFNEMVRRGLHLTWDATNGVIARSCVPEVIAAAEQSGCIALNIGMESGNPDILRRVKKPGTVDTFLDAAAVLRRHPRIYASVLLMIGFPGETMAMIQDTITVSRQMDLDWYRISPLEPLPNTPIYDALVAQGVIAPATVETRFMGGAYGKQAEIEQGLRPPPVTPIDVRTDIPPNQVPTPEQITDVWFDMNYTLNFARLFTEERSIKIQQQLRHLAALGDIISPENGFALYFSGVLQRRLQGSADAEIVDRLTSRLSSSAYWRDRFRRFGLAPDDLRPTPASV